MRLRPHLSITVERLVKLAYIARIKDKQDGRKVNLTLTKEGERIKRSKSVLDPQLVQAVLTRLTEAERKLALDGVGLLAYAAEMEMKSRSLGLVTRNNGQHLPFGGTWEYRIGKSGDGATVTITEDGEGYNPLFRFVSKFIMGHTGTLKRYSAYLESSFK